MNAPAKIDPPSANLAIWEAVSKTDPAHTKRVNQRGGFTAISAHYQVMSATAQFGPIGKGWGYENGEPIWKDNLVFVPVTLWHGERSNTFGPVFGGAEWKSAKGHLDSDAPKKAATDGLTKALSQLGFNADVFLGRFDDNKYVQQMEREFAEGHSQGEGHGAVSPRQTKPAPWREESAHYPNPSKLHKGLTVLERELAGCGDSDMVYGVTATDEWKEFVRVCEIHAPHYLRGGDPAPPEFEGLLTKAERLVKEFDTATANHMTDLARA